MDRPAELAEADLGTLGNDGDVLYANGCAVLRCDDRVLDVLYVTHQSDGAHVDLLHPCLDKAAARVDVVVGELLLHLADGEAVGNKLIRVDAHLVFARGGAKDRHVDNIRNLLELLHQHPVHQRLAFHGVILRVRAPEREKVDLAGRAEVRADAGLKTGWKVDHGQPLQDPLAVLKIIRVVIEPDDHDRQPGNGHGTQVRAVGYAAHTVLDGDGDLLLHLLGRYARPLRDDPGVIVGGVGIGLDIQMHELNNAQAEQKDTEGQHHPAVAQGKIDNSANHCLSPLFSRIDWRVSPCCCAVYWSTRAVATTFWPGVIPVTSCKASGSIFLPTISTSRNSPLSAGT